MAYQVPTLDTLTQLVLGYFRDAFKGQIRDFSDTGWLGKQARAIALALLGHYQAVDSVAVDSVPSKSTSTGRLDDFAILFGLSDGQGGLGRKKAVAATGGQGPLTYSGAGPFPYTLPTATRLTDSTGLVGLQLAADVTWGAAGSQTANVDAVTVGTAGNLGVGSILTFSPAPPAGVAPGLTLTGALSGGLDVESNSDLLARILDRLQNPPKAGTAKDWARWATAISPIASAFVYPLRRGTGTVSVVCVKAGTGTARAPSSVALVLASFDSERLVCVEGREALIPYMPSGAGCDVVVRALPTIGNLFDWDSSGGAWTVSSWVAGSRTLTLSGALPADFIAAVAVGTPRLQLRVTGQVLPSVVKVEQSSYDAGAHSVVVTSDSLPSSWGAQPPQVGDSVFAGGNVVLPVAEAVLALVDALGPSRACGFADPDAFWDDTLRVDEVVRVAMGATSGGARLVKDLVAPPTIDGSSANKQAADDGINAPQLLYLKSVAVTP